MKGRIAHVVAAMLAATLFRAALPAQAQRVTLKVTVEGVERTAVVDPGSDAAVTPSPVVLAFHGLGGPNAAREMAQEVRIKDAWPEATVVYPQGLPFAQGDTGFLTIPGDAGDRDLKFVDALLQTLGSTYKVDERRVYATGYSNGSHFTLHLLAARPERFAAFAPVAGGGDIHVRWATVPRPVLLTVGKRDLLYETERSRNQILRLNDCSAETTEWLPGALLYQPCSSGQPVIVYLHAGAHIWPADATARIVQFFKEHTLSAPPQGSSPVTEPLTQESVAGTGQIASGPVPDGTPAASASIFFPTSVTLDRAGNILFLAAAGTRLRKIGLDGRLATPARSLPSLEEQASTNG